MKGLLIKDFKLMLIRKNYFLILCIITFFLSFSQQNLISLLSYLSCVGLILSFSSISYDEFDNGNAFLFSLPISRKDYVYEKYLFCLIISSGFWIFGYALFLITSLIRQIPLETDVSVGAISILLLTFFVLAITLPFYLKFGSEKGRMAIITVYGILFVCIFGIGTLFNLFHISLPNYIIQALNSSTKIIFTCAFVFTLLLLIASCIISISIINKKDF